MDEFSYLSVLLSIIIGLAITEILQGIRGYMQTHARVKPYWPTTLWAATLLLIATQTWWAMFGLRARHNWEFDDFVALLIQTILLYLTSGLVFPEFDFEGKATVDLRAHYFVQRKRFFALLIASSLASVYRDIALNNSLPERTNLIFHALFVLAAASAIVIEREWFHKVLAIVVAAIFVVYVTSLFPYLR